MESFIFLVLAAGKNLVMNFLSSWSHAVIELGVREYNQEAAWSSKDKETPSV